MWWLSHAHHVIFCKVSARGLKIGSRFHKTLASVTFFALSIERCYESQLFSLIITKKDDKQWHISG